MNNEVSNERISNNSSPQFMKTDGGKTKSNAIEIPGISLPKGGGAIKGIDEKFSVNPVNGTASFTVQLPFSPARGGVTPALNLTYSSGAGNDVFGLGWSLGLPSIKRKTDQGLPKYLDDIESDTFLFSETEDLVPEFQKSHGDLKGGFALDDEGNYQYKELHPPDSPHPDYVVRFYRPRIEGLFARIEKWININSGEIKWRVITKDNRTTLFGWSEASRICDPKDPNRIYEWKPEFAFDDQGNCLNYIYQREDAAGFESSLLHHKNRMDQGAITYTNLYLAKILYGNKTPYQNLNDQYPDEQDYMFQTVFDYGEYEGGAPFKKIREWNFRKDAFSEYQAGFEIRTTRCCERIMLFHYFDELPGGSSLVKSLNLEYDTAAEGFTFLTAITSHGYIKKADGTYTEKHLPPLEFQYQEHSWSKEVKNIAPDELLDAPAGLDEPQYLFTDLYGEGLAGILTEQGGALFYKRNLGGSFADAQQVSPKPSFAGLGSRLHLLDLDGDGTKQLVSMSANPKGYFELGDNEDWQTFKAFRQMPSFNLEDNNLRLMDINNDGKQDILITEDQALVCYESSGRKGFEIPYQTLQSFNEEEGPNLLFSDLEQSIFLADMSGDGLSDIVRIRNGAICYWPNLGYGRFGTKVGMDHAPVFDHDASFNPSYIRLADIDGSGTTDVIYLGKNKFSCWLNVSGNGFSSLPFEIDPFPEVHDQAKVTVVDLLGNGLACITWSSPLAKDKKAPLKYIDLMESKKPHLMTFYKNNLGKEVTLSYTPSTRFYLDDKLAGRPWVTKLHFPVYCLSKIETRDKISGLRFVSQYRYHHGYYDHGEREFRGFGMVEQTDTEDFEHWVQGTAGNIVEKVLHQEPVVTKSWFHTGAFLDRENILNHFAGEYWQREMARQGFEVESRESSLPEAKLMAAPGVDPSLLDKLVAQEWKEALRACKGMELHREIFAYDAPVHDPSSEDLKRQLTPYSVAAHNCVIQLLQPKGRNKHAVFAVQEREALTYDYERNTEDPRITHNLNIKLDEYGNILESAAVVYPRSKSDPSLPAETQSAQKKTLITYTQNSYTNDIDDQYSYRLRLPAEAATYELKGLGKKEALYTVADFEDVLAEAGEAAYHEINKNPPSSAVQKRLVEKLRTLYRSNNLKDALPLSRLESMALPFESYQLAYTPQLLEDIFGSRVNEDLMLEGRFTKREGEDSWWIRSGTNQYLEVGEARIQAQNRFYRPVSYTDPYGAKTKVRYLGSYHLFIEETEDPLGNKTGVDLFNFRTLAPQRMKDMNHNLSETIFDELGLVKAMAVMGKGSEADDLLGLKEFSTPAEETLVDAFVNAPNSMELTEHGKNLLFHATVRFVYDFDAYRKSGKPAVIAAIAREEHYVKNNDASLQISFEFSNGLGQMVMKKVQAEPGKAKTTVVNPDHSYGVSEVDTAQLVPQQLRWIGSGRKVLNNKGNTVKQYEPYFSAVHGYEDLKELVETGVTPIMYYDALGRLIKTELPDGTFTRVEFDAWKQVFSDQNDTVLESSWYQDRAGRLIDATLINEGKDPEKEKTAAEKAAKHAHTPNIQHFDNLGRPILSVEHNRHLTAGEDEFYLTRIELDIEGNLRKVIDPRGNTAMQFKYDLLGRKVYQKSMDGGQRRLLLNILEHPLRTWDERNHEFQYFYDILQRPLSSKVIGGDGAAPLNNIFKRYFYGETEQNPEDKNLRGQVIKHYDSGGLLIMPEYDFKGQPKSTIRMLYKNYQGIVDWTDANLVNDLETESYPVKTESDALGRIVQQTVPDGSLIMFSYNETGLVNRERVLHNNAGVAATYIKDIDYNEKGQRNKITYGNDVFTLFNYDEKTFRLKGMATKRQNGDPLQDLHYTYDPIGNITHIEDRNIPVRFFDNQKIAGAAAYTYDALYRLAEATGRENNETLTFDSKDNWNDIVYLKQFNSGDPMNMRNYTQSYIYDVAGNILQMRHQAAGNNWTREYSYEPANNRLISTQVGGQIYTYQHHKQHGYLTAMPHLEEMGWNFKEELIRTTRQKRTDGGTGETTYYQYDGQGRRLRKITENQADPGITPGKKDERIYLGSFELYKQHSGADAGLERTSLSLMDQQHRFVMIDTETTPGSLLGIPMGASAPVRTVRYQLHNHLGSAALELDAAARVISYEEYHPFGTTAYQAKDASIKCAAKRYRYTGMERDEESGLEYHSARYYSPWLGRWLSPDPIGIADGVNLYQYVRGNPICRNDFTGKSWRDIVKGVAVGLGTALVVVAVVATAPISIPTSVAVGLTVTGVAVTGATVVQSARRRDLFNNPISEEQADFQMGTAFGGLLAAPFSGPTSAGLSQIGGRTLAPATGPLLSEAVVVTPVLVEAASGVTATALPILATMSSSGSGGGGSSQQESTPSSSEPAAEPAASEPVSSEPPVSEGTYSSQGGHHVHQSASYSPGGPSATGNPNHASAVTVALEGHSTDLLSQHGRATAVQRIVNRSVRGSFSGEAEIGPVTIRSSGEGTLPPAPSQTFEDLKAFYSMTAAEAPGFTSVDDVYNLVCRSGNQLPNPPVRVPSR